MTRTRDSKSLDGNIMGCDHWPMSNVGKCAQSPVSPTGPHHCQLSWRTGPHKYRGRPLDHTHCRAGLILIYDSIPTIWKPLTSELSLCPNYKLTLLRVKLLYWSGHVGGWRITQYWSVPRGDGWTRVATCSRENKSILTGVFLFQSASCCETRPADQGSFSGILALTPL